MKTYSQPGEILTLTAPSGGVVSGTAYLIGTLVVIATETVAQTLSFAALVCGVVDVPKVADEGWTEGLKLYWDDSAKKFTATASTNTLVGVAVQPIIPLSVTLASTALAADLAIDNDALTIQVLDYATLAGGTPPTITVTIDGTAHVLTEGTDWTAETDDETTAINIAAAIAALTGVNCAAPSTDTLTVIPATGSHASAAAVGRVRLDGACR